MDAAAVASMERVLVRPIGSGAVVTLRQRFGDLPAGPDGLVTVAVAGGTVLSVSSSLARDTGAPAPATRTAEQAYAAALADARLTAGAVGQPHASARSPCPPRGRAAGRVRGDRDRRGHRRTRPRSPPTWTAAPAACWSARTSSTSTRTTRAGRSSRPPRRATSAPGRTPGCAGAATRRPAARRPSVTRPPASRGTSTRPPARRPSPRAATRPTPCCPGARGTPAVPGHAQPGPQLRVPVHRPVAPGPGATRRCSPPPSATTWTRRSANLFAMHNRMHDWSYQLGFTEAAWNLQADNLDPGGLGGDAEQGSAQAGRAAAGSREQRQPGHPARRAAADHQHVPVAAAAPAGRTRRAWTATTTCRSSATSTPTRSPTG